jgi:hypothetical protein
LTLSGSIEIILNNRYQASIEKDHPRRAGLGEIQEILAGDKINAVDLDMDQLV